MFSVDSQSPPRAITGAATRALQLRCGRRKRRAILASAFSMALQKQKITKDQLHELILERFGLINFFQVSEDRQLGFRTTVVAAPADFYELHSRLERICSELRPRFELE
nr:hypothetical protein [Bradyrhizobium sp. 2S1]MCK7664700.1 hypothetical protein [Bradyrhizobium sp. 2S1]MCK7664845.1 hypothetical protein [Bradyrhizobium sp. 2S1]